MAYIGVSPLTVKCIKNISKRLIVHDYMLFKTVVCREDFSILAKSSCNFKLDIQESILIKVLKPTLNKNISSVPLYLFDIDSVAIHYLENRRSNLIILKFI